MPSSKSETSVLMADVKARLDHLVAIAAKSGRDEALNQIRALVGGGLPVKRGPGRPPKSSYAIAPSAPVAAKPRKARRNPWANMTAEERADRVRKMQAGRGITPKAER